MVQDAFRALADFRYALRRFTAASEAISKSGGVTQQQYQALLAVGTWPGQGMVVKDLAEQLLLTHHAAVQMVDRLAKAGLVQRERSQQDRRSVLVSLTEGGASLLEALAERHLRAMVGEEPALSSALNRLRALAPGGARPLHVRPRAPMSSA